MDLRALRYFQTVAEYGSYSRGSQVLRISQPAVSRAIRKLEDELGQPLFRRHGHGVTLTDAGALLLERSREVLRQLERTTDEIRGGLGGASGTIAIALPPAAGQRIAPALVAAMTTRFPNVFVRLVGGYSGTIHRWLARGQVDMALAHDPIPQRELLIRPLLREEVVIVGRSGLFAPAPARLTAPDVARMPLILPGRPNASRRLLDAWGAPAGVVPEAAMEVDDHLITRALLRQGRGFSLMTEAAVAEELARDELEARPLDPPIRWTLALITSARGEASCVETEVAALLEKILAEKVAAGGWPGAELAP